MPTFNRPELLRRAIDCALRQTLQPLEVLVCEDGPSDVTRAVAESFGNELVRYLPAPHTGAPALPRNRGIAAATGDWIAFLDDDDLWYGDKLEQQARVLSRHGVRALAAPARLVMPDGEQRGVLGCTEPLLGFARLIRGNCLVVSSVVLHRTLFDEVGPFQDVPTAHEDYSMWLRVATVSDFASTSQPVLDYLGRFPVPGRQHTTSDKWALRRRTLEYLVRDETRPDWNRRFRQALAVARLRQSLLPLEGLFRSLVSPAVPN